MFSFSQKHEWSDLYPKDSKIRSKIHEYFNWHHQHSRNFTLGFFRKIFFPNYSKHQIQVSEKVCFLKL